VTTSGISWNVEQFNGRLKEEVQDEDQALSQLISTTRMIDLQGQMNDVYQTAEKMRVHLTSIMSRVTDFTIESADQKVDIKKLDMSKVKVPYQIKDNIQDLMVSV